MGRNGARRMPGGREHLDGATEAGALGHGNTVSMRASALKKTCACNGLSSFPKVSLFFTCEVFFSPFDILKLTVCIVYNSTL